MAVEVLDGSIEAAEPKSLKRTYAVFDTLRFRDRSGTERTLKNICTGGDITDIIRKGGIGRFYVSSGGGQTGIHGVRLDNGKEAYAHYTNMEMIVLLGIAAGIAAFVVGLVTGEMMLLPVIIGVLLIGAYAFMRNIRVSGKQQYDADARKA
jgi:hypothetical protein